MNELKNKHFIHYDYKNRDAQTPVYFNTKFQMEVMGIGTNIKKNAPFIIHNVMPGDTLDNLSLRYYNNPTYWWVICQFNLIFDPFIHLADRYKTLRIPSISSIEFGDYR